MYQNLEASAPQIGVHSIYHEALTTSLKGCGSKPHVVRVSQYRVKREARNAEYPGRTLLLRQVPVMYDLPGSARTRHSTSIGGVMWLVRIMRRWWIRDVCAM